MANQYPFAQLHTANKLSAEMHLDAVIAQKRKIFLGLMLDYSLEQINDKTYKTLVAEFSALLRKIKQQQKST